MLYINCVCEKGHLKFNSKNFFAIKIHIMMNNKIINGVATQNAKSNNLEMKGDNN